MLYNACMEVMTMKKNLLKLLTKDKEIRIFIVDATHILESSNLKDMNSDFARQLYTNIFIDCCLLRGFLTEVDHRINVSIRFKTAGYTAHCDIDGSGNVNCTFSSQLAAFNGDFADLVGDGASLSISRASWMAGIFTGTVELKSVSIDSCFSYFYSKSEQTKTIFRTWIENGIARGCLIQPLPFYNTDNLQFVTDTLDSADKYITKEQLDKIKNNIESYKAESEIETEWIEFISKLNYCYENKLPNTDLNAIECINYWRKLMNKSIGEDENLKNSIFSFHASLENSQFRYGLTDELYK